MEASGWVLEFHSGGRVGNWGIGASDWAGTRVDNGLTVGGSVFLNASSGDAPSEDS